MSNPLLYELNTRCWLRELSTRSGRAVRLDRIPEAEFQAWQRRGFTHLWLMGVWTTGPLSRAVSLVGREARQRYAQALPDWREADVCGSPYAIADYRVPADLGGDAGLQTFRRQLNDRGLKLLLDFVPNHLGLDHAWVAARPDVFVQSPTETQDVFRQESPRGARWLAHGRDPNFPCWRDTVQLDYRLPETRRAALELLQSVARRCDGVRCDMAMLLLNEVFARTWQGYLPVGQAAESEFWAEAIQAVKAELPGFMFFAEAYWDLEARLQDLGFDYTYDKRLYDYLVYRNRTEAQRHLLGVTPRFVAASAHFLENHDEPRIASILSSAEHRAAALLMLGLPGLRLLHEGQLTGAQVHVPVALARRAIEPPQPQVVALYDALLATLPKTAVGAGRAELLRPRPAWSDNPTAEDFVLVQWQASAGGFDVVVVNLAEHRSQCYAPLTIPELSQTNWRLKDLLGDEIHVRRGDDLVNQGLYLDVAAYAAQLFHCQPVA
ncbi:MAG: alpha-amylase [Verrucomicrobia bacterium]|nr:alpha-amylase [Verrucomicrobiota bacterium]